MFVSGWCPFVECLSPQPLSGASCRVHCQPQRYGVVIVVLRPQVVTVTLGGPALIDFFRCTADGSAGEKVVEVPTPSPGAGPCNKAQGALSTGTA